MSLYLKYRPHDFDNLVWQDFIKNTLKTAILNNRTVWAYLLCGPRWTWKTSTARILAKSINCLKINNWNPCLKCEICTDFLEEKLIDIIEIDAASHTWVDNIRDLIQKAQFNPTRTKYKVYIIDEVHMLSKWAFNALLKILEEPPSHVKFILATTETNKVPDTIISRCQRYDFKKISNIDIKNRLEFIAKLENIQIDNNSIDYIIKNSWWWLRNAISLFEQYIINWEINYNDIIKNIWLVSNDLLINFYNLLINWDKLVIIEFEKLIDNWINIKLFFKQLIFLIKDDWIKKINSNNDIWKIVYILEILDEVFIKSKNSLDENTTFLIGLLKIINFFNFWEKINQENSIEKNNDIFNKTTEFKNNNLVIKNKINKLENSANISNEDINNIFWSNNKKNILEEIEYKKESENIDININNSNFDLDLFINELKKIWAKSWLTMWIRWSNIKLYWNKLEISFKTKFALNTVNTSENINILNKAFENIWFIGWTVILL